MSYARFELIPEPKPEEQGSATLDDIWDFIMTHGTCGLATVDLANPLGAIPELASVEFGIEGSGDSRRVLVDTRPEYWKVPNMRNWPYVALAFHDYPEQQTVQMNGVARELRGESLARAMRVYTQYNERFKIGRGAAEFGSMQDAVAFAIRPYLIRFVDVSFDPHQKVKYQRAVPAWARAKRPARP